MKLSSQAESVAQEAYYQALSSQMAGGRLTIVTSGGMELVSVSLPTDLALASAEGFVYENLQQGEVKKVGDPAKFQVVASDGKIVLEGTIGFDDDVTDATKEPADMVMQAKDKRLYPGMKLNIGKFAYTQANG